MAGGLGAAEEFALKKQFYGSMGQPWTGKGNVDLDRQFDALKKYASTGGENINARLQNLMQGYAANPQAYQMQRGKDREGALQYTFGGMSPQPQAQQQAARTQQGSNQMAYNPQSYQLQAGKPKYAGGRDADHFSGYTPSTLQINQPQAQQQAAQAQPGMRSISALKHVMPSDMGRDMKVGGNVGMPSNIEVQYNPMQMQQPIQKMQQQMPQGNAYGQYSPQFQRILSRNPYYMRGQYTPSFMNNPNWQGIFGGQYQAQPFMQYGGQAGQPPWQAGGGMSQGGDGAGGGAVTGSTGQKYQNPYLQNLYERWGAGNQGQTIPQRMGYRTSDRMGDFYNRRANTFGNRANIYGQLGMTNMQNWATGRQGRAQERANTWGGLKDYWSQPGSSITGRMGVTRNPWNVQY